MTTAYSNLRRDPFTSAYSYRVMDTESHQVAEFDELPGRYGFQLQDKPETGSVVVTEDVTGGSVFVQVSVAPLVGQCRIDYVSGYIYFNLADDLKNTVVDYNGGGTNSSKEAIESMVNNQQQLDDLDDAVFGTGGLEDRMDVVESDINETGGILDRLTQNEADISTNEAGIVSLESDVNGTGGLEDRVTALEGQLEYKADLAKSSPGGLWADIVHKDDDEFIVMPKGINGIAPFIGAYLNDKTFLELSSAQTIKLAVPGSGGHIIDGITAVLANSKYILWPYEDSGNALAFGLTKQIEATFSNANPTITLTLNQVNGQDIGLLFAVDSEISILQDGDEWEGPYAYQDGGAITEDKSRDVCRISSRTSTVLTLPNALGNAGFTAGSAVCQVNNFKPLAINDGLIADVIGARGYTDSGFRIVTDGSGNIVPFVDDGDYVMFDNGSGSADYNQETGVEVFPLTTSWSVKIPVYAPVDKIPVYQINAAAVGTDTLLQKSYWSTYGQLQYCYIYGTYAEDNFRVHGLCSIKGASTGTDLVLRGYKRR